MEITTKADTMEDRAENLSILFVDDNPLDIMLTRLAFDACGVCYTAQEIYSGTDALKLIETWKTGIRPAIDVVVLDYYLPDMHGSVIQEAIAGIPACNDTLILLMSGLDADLLPAQEPTAGPVYFCKKPPMPSDIAHILSLAGLNDRLGFNPAAMMNTTVA